MAVTSIVSCGRGQNTPSPAVAAPAVAPATERKYLLERVDDAAVVQVYADGFEKLPARQARRSRKITCATGR